MRKSSQRCILGFGLNNSKSILEMPKFIRFLSGNVNRQSDIHLRFKGKDKAEI